MEISDQFVFERPQNPFQWEENIPKVELHVHLEGAIPLQTMFDLVTKYGGDPDVPDMLALKHKFKFTDFAHFIDTWYWKNKFLREYDDFTLIAEGVARDMAQQNIRYAEAFYSPIEYERYGLTVSDLTAAIRKGFDRVPEVSVALIADLVRDAEPALGMRTLEELRDVQALGVIGIGIGGSEQIFPPEPWAEVYAQARAWGFHTTAHAGEAAGADSMWGAIRALQVERIGHGTRAEEDPKLLDYLAEHRLPLEMCPLSNVRTGVVRDLKHHPIRRYYDRGLMVTVNTDDPKMFDNTLALEYYFLRIELGFTRDEIKNMILNAIRASWLPESGKRLLEASFIQDPAWSAR